MTKNAVATVASLLLLAACGDEPATQSGEPTTTTAHPIVVSTTDAGASETSLPSPEPTELDGNDAIDGPVMRYPESSDTNTGADAVVTGVLELDGSCLYLGRDGLAERYPVLWPAGTRWDEDRTAVISPTGELMTVGDEVSGSGGYVDVANVERLAGPQASTLARSCVDNTDREIAVVNNSATAIAPT